MLEELLSTFKNNLDKQKGKIFKMNMRHEWYLFTSENIKEGVNFINFTWEFHSTLSVQLSSDGAFNIEIHYLSIVIEF